jgi:hypothetical protein
MTPVELRKLRKNLPKGSIEILASRFSCSTGHIRNVLSGGKSNKEIIIAASEILEEHLRRYESAQQFVQSL